MLQCTALLCTVIVYVYVIISIIRRCCNFVIFIGYVCIYVRLHVCVCVHVCTYVCVLEIVWKLFRREFPVPFCR